MAENKQEMITLREAYSRWRHETGSGNAYDWYRRNAQEGRKVFDINAPYGAQGSTRKIGRVWMISVKELEDAIKAHRGEKDKIKRATEDYKRHILHGKTGSTIQTTWGFYTVHKGIHSTTLSSPDPAWNGAKSWYCSVCWKPAETEHNNPECHRCRDWSSCGQDCTFSRAFCPKCGASYPP
jgi:hypothetical protein